MVWPADCVELTNDPRGRAIITEIAGEKSPKFSFEY